MANRENVEAVTDFLFLDSEITVDGDCSHKIRWWLLGRKARTSLDSALRSTDITLLTKVCISQSYGFFSHHIWIWELDHKESWAPKNWCFQTVVLKKALESPLDSKTIKPVNPKGNQHWILIGRVGWCWSWSSKLWPSDEKSWFIGKDPDAGKDWRREKKRATEDEMVGWRHWLNGDESAQIPGDGEG